jgi:cytochrome c-type biogenesis protein CcmH/NrfG
MVAAWRRYLALAPASDPDRRVVEAAVRRHEAAAGAAP